MRVTRFAGGLTRRRTLPFINKAIVSSSKMPPTIKVDDAFINSTGTATVNFFKLKFSFVELCDVSFDRMFSCYRDFIRCRGRDRSNAKEENNDSRWWNGDDDTKLSFRRRRF